MNSTAHTNLKTDSDANGAWFAQALRGDSDAATRLYDHCVPAVRAWLARSVPPAMAEDFAHEAMVRAFRCADQYRPGTSFEAWMRTMAHRMALNALRTDTRRKTRETAFSEESELHDDTRDEAVFAALERCVADLSGEQRQLIRQRFQLNRSASEIAASIGRSRGAVAVSIHRICLHLRAAMKRCSHFSLNQLNHTHS